MKKVLVIPLVLILVYSINAQSFAFGLKGGLTIASQKWDNYDRNPIFKYHGVLFIESAKEDVPGGMFAQAGYHIRGSGLKNIIILNHENKPVSYSSRQFIFENISLGVGVKQRKELGNYKGYYAIGFRGEYNIRNNLDELHNGTAGYYNFTNPGPAYVKKFTFGLIFGGGVNFPLTDLIGVFLEASINPDLLLQYEQPPIENVVNPVTGRTETIRERKIKNMSLELSVGFRFLRKVVYID